MINITLSLHDKNIVEKGLIEKNILQRNPIIFIITGDDDESIFQIVNKCDSLRRNILVLNSFDLERAISFLLSFPNIQLKKILICAPVKKKNSAINFSKGTLKFFKRMEDADKPMFNKQSITFKMNNSEENYES